MLTEAEIKEQADSIAHDLIDLLSKRAAKLPTGVTLAIPLGVAAALFVASGLTRTAAVCMLDQAFNDIERG